MIGEEATEKRPNDRRDAEHRPERTLIGPRSRSGITSPINAVAVTVIPPAPGPCIARAAISHSMLCAAPLNAEPITNTIVLT